MSFYFWLALGSFIFFTIAGHEIWAFCLLCVLLIIGSIESAIDKAVGRIITTRRPP